jgi:hypothetical protein
MRVHTRRPPQRGHGLRQSWLSVRQIYPAHGMALHRQNLEYWARSIARQPHRNFAFPRLGGFQWIRHADTELIRTPRGRARVCQGPLRLAQRPLRWWWPSWMRIMVVHDDQVDRLIILEVGAPQSELDELTDQTLKGLHWAQTEG